jgi:hypothetical protein
MTHLPVGQDIYPFSTGREIGLYDLRACLFGWVCTIQETIDVNSFLELDIRLRFIWLESLAIELYSLGKLIRYNLNL